MSASKIVSKQPMMYGGFVQSMAAAFENAMSGIEAEYNFDLGNEFEIVLCNVLRRMLPQRFGICRGFVVNRLGDTAGDDVLIYDRMRFPTARLLCEDFSRKEKVPIDAMLAYIEAKHTLEIEGESSLSLTHALKQAGKVKALCERRPAVPLTHIADGVVFEGPGISVKAPLGWPAKRNPFYSAIMARHVRIRAGQARVTNAASINKKLLALSNLSSPLPDLIVAGRSNVVVPNFTHGDIKDMCLSPFILVPGGGGLSACIAEGNGFGLAVAHLLWALDYIALNKMPWAAIFDDAVTRV